MLFPAALPILDDFGRAALGANWVNNALALSSLTLSGGAATASVDNTSCAAAWAAKAATLEVAYIRVPTMPPTANTVGIGMTDDVTGNDFAFNASLIFVAGAWKLRCVTDFGTSADGAAAFVSGDWLACSFNGATVAAWWLSQAGGGWQQITSKAAPYPNGTQGWRAYIATDSTTTRIGPFGAQTMPGTDPTLNARNELGRGAC